MMKKRLWKALPSYAARFPFSDGFPSSAMTAFGEYDACQAVSCGQGDIDTGIFFSVRKDNKRANNSVWMYFLPVYIRLTVTRGATL